MRETLQNTVEVGDASEASALVRQALDSGIPASNILNDAMIPAMNHVGKLFEEGEYFISQIASRSQNSKNLLFDRPLYMDKKRDSSRNLPYLVGA